MSSLTTLFCRLPFRDCMVVQTTLAIICILGVKFNGIFRKKLRGVTKLNISYYLKILGGTEATKNDLKGVSHSDFKNYFSRIPILSCGGFILMRQTAVYAFFLLLHLSMLLKIGQQYFIFCHQSQYLYNRRQLHFTDMEAEVTWG